MLIWSVNTASRKIIRKIKTVYYGVYDIVRKHYEVPGQVTFIKVKKRYMSMDAF